MLKINDLVPRAINYEEYIAENNLLAILGLKAFPSSSKVKKTSSHSFTVDPSNEIPLSADLEDLSRLHYIACSRKVTTILEFGVGKSTAIFGNALALNRQSYYDLTSRELRRGNLYECHSIDNSPFWIKECSKIIPNEIMDNKTINFHLAKLNVSDFCGRVCTFYDPLPNLCPDLIYLDGPDQFSPNGDIRGLTTNHQDRMPMSGDILAFEHFLQPGTLIIIDGRTANARFLASNLQRRWAYCYSADYDQHFFELQEEPLGIYNRKMLDHCLGENYFERLSK